MVLQMAVGVKAFAVATLIWDSSVCVCVCVCVCVYERERSELLSLDPSV